MSTSCNDKRRDGHSAVRAACCPSLREVAGATLLLAALLILFFWPATLGGRVLSAADLIFDIDPLWRPIAPEGFVAASNPILGDPVYQFYPWRVFTLRSLSQGEIPLWNPFTDGGLPFVGNAQSAIFSLFNIAGYALPAHAAPLVVTLLRLLFGGTCTYLFARELNISHAGALLAMVTFALCGPVQVWLEHPHSAAILWLPAMLLTIERALSRRSTGYALAGALTVGAQLLEGHPETSFHALAAWFAYALYRAFRLDGRRATKVLPQLGRIALAVVLGILLASVQLFPSVEAVLNSATLGYRQAQASSRSTATLPGLLSGWREWPTAVTALLPQFFGTEQNGSYWYPFSNSVEQNTYVGVLPAILALAAIVPVSRHGIPRYRQSVVVLAAVAAISLGVALGAPLLAAIEYVPPFNIVANGRLRLVYAFAMSVLAGIGLDVLGSGRGDVSKAFLRLLAMAAFVNICLAAAATAGLVVFKDDVINSGIAFVDQNWGNPYLSQPRQYYYGLVRERYARKLALYHPQNVTMYVPVLVAAGYACWHWLGRESRARGTLMAYGVLCITTLDLFSVGIGFHPTVNRSDVFPEPGAIAYLRQDPGVYRVCATDLTLNPNAGMVFGLSDVRGYDTVVPRRYAQLVDHLEGHYRSHSHSLFTNLESPLLDLLNTKYVLTDQQLSGKWRQVYTDADGVTVYRNDNVLPRAFIVYDTQVVGSGAEALTRLLDESFDFRNSVVLEQTPGRLDSTRAEPTVKPVVIIDEYRPSEISMIVSTDSDGLLVLTDNYAPGWEASVDEQPTEVFRADYAFRAVVVPAGDHRVTFVYRPVSFRLGLRVSMASAIVALLGAVFLRVRSSRAVC